MQRLPPLADWIPATNRRYRRPYHLLPFIELMESIVRGIPFRFLGSAPPRHAKTDTCCIAFAVWLLLQRPELMITYATYGASLAQEKNIAARELARRVGVVPGRINTQALWTTRQGGGLRALGVGGPFIGKGTNVLLADDVFKDRVEAESPLRRGRVWDWWTDVAMQRLEPGGSVAVFGARWHPDDLIGKLKDEGWNYVNLPAVNEDDKALWPERWTRAELRQKEIDVQPYGWASLYQGNPVPRGANVFQNCTLRATGVKENEPRLPPRLTLGIGIDCAYTAKQRSDWNIAIVLGREATRVEAGHPMPKPIFHILRILRRQCTAPQWAAELKALRVDFPHAPIRWVASGTEVGTCDFLNAQGIPVEFVQAKGDKFIRAIPAAAAWNDGRITVDVEKYLPGVNDFLAVLNGFTGVSDVHDDDVDALSAAHSLLDTGDLAEALMLGQL